MQLTESIIKCDRNRKTNVHHATLEGQYQSLTPKILRKRPVQADVEPGYKIRQQIP